MALWALRLVIASWIAAHYISWKSPRLLQHIQKAISQPIRLATLNRLHPRSRYTKEQISPHFWPNGKMPVREDWKQMAADNFRDFKLKVGGLVENPVELSLSEIQALGEDEHITMHHCIQGWSGIAQWNGVPMKKLIELVKPKPSVTAVAFFSFGEDSVWRRVLRHPEPGKCAETGVPACLRDEWRTAYSRVWRAASAAGGEPTWDTRWSNGSSGLNSLNPKRGLGKGEGGANEDDEYFDLLPNI